MKRKNKIFLLDLQLFAEGAEGASGVTGSAAGTQEGVKGNSLDTVQYGVQQKAAPAAEVQETEVVVDRDSEFEKLIKGEYKDLYNARVQKTVQDRLKSSKETVEKYNALQPTLEILAAKYGVDIADIDALNKAIEEDDSYFADEALEKGITVDELKRIRKIERENADLRQRMQEQQTQENAAKIYTGWLQQAEETKGIYASFDLEAEMQNPAFVDLLQAHIPVRTAYEVIHKDEIISGAMQFTAKKVEEKIANGIAANRARPAENGLSSQGATMVKNDVNKLTNDDLKEIHRRVARGERITFG